MKNARLINGWITHAWRKEDADHRIIQLQKSLIIMLFILCIAFFIGWITAPSRLTIYLPPDIQNGSTMKAGTIPSSLIYSFAYEIWQELNNWPTDGETDFKKNIEDYWAYLTPQFKTELLNNYQELKTKGQLQRIRYLLGKNGSAFDVANIKKIDNDTWEVDLKMHLVEYKNNQIIKDVEILYPLKVTRINLARSINPYGLAIAGFVFEPKRINPVL